jgi:hypothetical protein
MSTASPQKRQALQAWCVPGQLLLLVRGGCDGANGTDIEIARLRKQSRSSDSDPAGAGEYAAFVVTELVAHEPSAGLRKYVVRCEGFSERTAGPLRRREVAYPAVPVILSFGTDWWLFDTDVPDAPGQRVLSFVAGLADRPAIVEQGSEARVHTPTRRTWRSSTYSRAR